MKTTMRILKIFLLPAIILVAGEAFAQPSAYPGSAKVSYVRTWSATAPVSNENAIPSMASKDARQSTTYIDGQGRSVQSVIKEGSYETGGTAKDMVNAKVFDDYGRERYKYLSFGSSGSDGSFKFDPFQQQATFMSSQYSAQGEVNYYSKVNFETSPLNSVLKSMPAGDNWVGSDRGTEVKYWFNTVTDSVRIWTVNNNSTVGEWGNYTTGSNDRYPAGTLYKTITVDEHSKQVVEFKDKEGKVILKKVQLTATADVGGGTGYTGWLCTYYIYDLLGNLRCVIQPRGVELIASNSWALTSSIMEEQCFMYEYDQRNRLIVKRVPGGSRVQIVYDARDRLVMTQDSLLLGQGQWLVTQYDALNRLIETGLWTNNSNAGTHRSAAASASSYPSITGTYSALTISHYDDYTSLPSGLSSSFLTSWNSYFSSTNNSVWPYPQMPVKGNTTKGLVTWTKIKILGTSNWISSCNIYDSSGKIIQVQTVNITGGLDVETTQYSWSGQPLITVEKQAKSGTNSQTFYVLTRITYDDLWRVIKIEKKTSHSLINDGTPDENWKIIVQNEYNKLGELKRKKLAPAYNSNAGIETYNFDYNIRGWLLGSNRSYVGTTGQNGITRFGYDLGYDKTTNSASRSYTAVQYNGNITGMVWKSDGDDVRRKYDYTYDAANRLMKGLYEQDNAAASWNNTTLNFKMQMGDGSDPLTAYDANGNIKGMSQWGWKLGGNLQIDGLTYNYYTNSNKLLNVIDGYNIASTKLGDFRTSSLHPNAGSKTSSTTDYLYDANGNIKKDLNKDIGTSSLDGITYNYLNLPEAITVRTTGGSVKGTITYTYDASGNKLKKEVAETGQSNKTTLYIGGAVYEDSVLQFISHEEGRIRFTPAASPNAAFFSYDYMVKDHLGNIRMVLTEEEKNDMYPAATMETANTTIETTYYNSIYETRSDPPANYPTNTPPGNAKVSKVKGNYREGSVHMEIGPGILLKVMAGDKFSFIVTSFWEDIDSPEQSENPLGLNQLLSVISQSPAVLNGGHYDWMELGSSTELSNAVTGFLTDQLYDDHTGGPKAYVSWIMFDDRFNYVSSGSGYEQVDSAGILQTHSRINLPVNKNGYVYVYVSNETPNIDVYFDNLQVTHLRGTLIEENHYYPFGLQIQAISSEALSFGISNKMRFQGQELAHKEFSDGSGLEMYEFKYRMDDPQIGRFWQIDPLASEYVYNSVYAFSENQVINAVELEGLEKENINDNNYNALKKMYLEAVASKSQAAQNWDENNTKLKFTLAITHGTVGAKVKAGAAEIAIYNSSKEKDLIGFRDNHFTTNGWDVVDQENVRRDADGGEIGIMGVTATYDKTVETRTALGGEFLSETTTYTKGFGFGSVKTISETKTSSGTTIKSEDAPQIDLNVKAGIGFIGFEIGVKIKFNPYKGSAYTPPSNYTPADNTKVDHSKAKLTNH